ncbi:hypothetical protein CC1G_00942 [Coprinopsis cinerea okayama7|uniref:Translation machinery-associated protein 16 n=1 Tax=Coprinopsis cinerea (strain Okayama-7 / 130 / ATCC MYA-4618 / FGSC 9003) TaxID=240176 RepID=A8N967_COPC7|nr:hypothetical protein CC1G_00942 [Coprinopsis cinerea okayama7\|eukprot:XP_001831395.2 hypothetical protein CC1G_00942 [Coprinopsis cinerea okayama7\
MPPKPAKKSSTTNKKEKIFHPSSRKAGQLARKALRKEKLQNLASKRTQKQGSTADFFGFFYHAIPEEGALTLEELHGIIRDVWLTRHDKELEEERAARRKGRPKSTREVHLEDLKMRETELYRTGMEVVDLTHEPTVELFRQWDQKEVAYLDLLRFIRIFSNDPARVIVSRPGKHALIVSSTAKDATVTAVDDTTMAIDEAPAT